ncbi:MAG: LysR family transcriptional regulator [Pseudomonadota bacterium]|nr:LysR family transcriptional regulator [Pseudomonadota bacterium]
MDSPSLRQLDIFAQMVAAGDASRCAADLGIGVDQLLADIAALELRLGYRLFEEPAIAARLTPAGRKTAQAMLQIAQDQDAAAADPPPEAAPLPLATPSRLPEPAGPTIMLAAPAPVFGRLQESLSAFEAANEDVAIALDLHVHDARDAAATIAAGRADIAYFYALGDPDGLPSRYGWSEPLNLYIGASHPLARMDSVSRAAMSVTPMIAFEEGGGMRRIIDAALVQGRAQMAAPALESDNMTDILAALRGGAGCFAAFGPLARDLGRMSGIRRLALDMPLPAIDVRQAVGPRAADKPAAGALAEFLFL